MDSKPEDHEKNPVINSKSEHGDEDSVKDLKPEHCDECPVVDSKPDHHDINPVVMSTSAEHNGDDEISAMILSPDPHQPSTKNESHSTPQINCLVLDMQYVKSFTGILKVIEIVLDIVAAICVGMVDVCGTSCLAEEFFQFVCSFTLLSTTALYFIHVFSLLQKIVFIKWPLVDCIFSVIFTLLYIIGSSLMAARAVTVSGKVASAFGFLAFIVYAMSLKHAYTVCKFGCKKQQSQPSPQKV